MANLRTSVIVDLAGNLESRARTYGRSIQRFSERGRQQLALLGRGAQFVDHEFRALGGVLRSTHGQLASLGLGVGLTATVAQAARLDKQLIQIKQTAGATDDQIIKLRNDVFDMATRTGQPVNDLVDGFNALIQAGFNFEEALATINAINPVVAVTSTNARDLAGSLAVAGKAFDFDLSKLDTSKKILDEMTVAGRAANAEIEDLSGIFSRVGINAAASNFSFEQTLAFIEQLSNIEMNPERLATLADSTLRLFTNAKYMKTASEALGIKFFDSKGARRDPVDVLNDISTKYKSLDTDVKRSRFIEVAFGNTDLDTQRGLRSLLSGDKGDNIAGIRKLTEQIAQAGGTIDHDLQEGIDNAVDQVGRLKAALRGAADDWSKGLRKGVSGGIGFLLDSKEKGGLELSGKEILAGGGALALTTLLAARYGGKAASAIGGKLMGTAGGVAVGKALEQTAGVTPVFVVNMPGGFGSGAGGMSPSGPGGWRSTIGGYGAGAASRGGRLMSMLNGVLGRVGLVGTALFGGVEAGKHIVNPAMQALDKSVLKDTPLALDKGIDRLVRLLAMFGHDESQAAVQRMDRFKQEFMGEVKITVDGEGRPRARVVSQRGPMGLTVDTGLMLSTP